MTKNMDKIKQLIKGGKLTEDQKRKILYSLKTMKEEYTGNVGGETDIANADNLVAEDEFTAATKPEPNVISKTFDTEADYDSYLNQHRGIEIISKEPTLPKSIVAERVGISVHTLYTHLKARRLKYLCEK